MFNKHDKGDFLKHQEINLGESDFKELLKLRYQIANAKADFAKSLDKNLKHVQKAVTIVDRSERNTIATTKNYYSEKPETAYVELRRFKRRNE